MRTHQDKSSEYCDVLAELAAEYDKAFREVVAEVLAGADAVLEKASSIEGGEDGG